MNRKNSFIFAFAILIGLSTFAQEGTRSTTESITVSKTSPVGKILLIPFDPNLYMSEIDRKIHQQTNWNFNQIREYFRHQLNTQIQFKLSKLTPVISFYKDSASRANDLNYVYQSTTISYDLVEPKKEDKKKTKEKPKNGIQGGQLVVKISDEKKFMNKKVVDPDLMSYLSKKYKAKYLIFVNELDIKNDVATYDIASDTYQRVVTVHYTIIDIYSKTIAAGIVTSKFSSKVNTPKKIANHCFSDISTKIVSIFSASFATKKI